MRWSTLLAFGVLAIAGCNDAADSEKEMLRKQVVELKREVEKLRAEMKSESAKPAKTPTRADVDSLTASVDRGWN